MPGHEQARSPIRTRAIALALAVCLIPTWAEAHTGLLGVGSFWSGVTHLLTSPDQLAFLLGLAIWTSFQDAHLDTRVVSVASSAVLIGVWVGVGLAAGARLNLLPAGTALMVTVGLAGAVRLRVGALPLLALSLVGGVVCGIASADAMSGTSVVLFSLGGSIMAASVLSYGLLAARQLESEWGSVVRRTGASWIAAIGVIVLAFLISSQAGRD
jgi:hydrogenase/urease accessory protein HupE